MKNPIPLMIFALLTAFITFLCLINDPVPRFFLVLQGAIWATFGMYIVGILKDPADL